jgi:hypothetical protein
VFFSWSCLTIIGSKLGPSSWSYGSWIYNDIDYIHCITTKVFEFESRSWGGVLNTTLFEKQIVFFVHGAEKKKKNVPIIHILSTIIWSPEIIAPRLGAFNIFQVYQYFTIYRRYFLLKFEQFSWISYTTLFKIRRYQRPF